MGSLIFNASFAGATSLPAGIAVQGVQPNGRAAPTPPAVPVSTGTAQLTAPVKGYELAKGRYVVVTEKDFEKARVKATQTFEIRDFVPADAIDDLYFDHPYYLAPAGPASAKPYALLRDALEKSGRVGVGTIVLRQREHLASVAPSSEALVLTTMRWSHVPPGADAMVWATTSVSLDVSKCAPRATRSSRISRALMQFPLWPSASSPRSSSRTTIGWAFSIREDPVVE